MSTDATIQLRHPIVVRFRSSLFHTASKSKWKASTPGNYLFACALTKLNKILVSLRCTTLIFCITIL
uniref:Uncharacterized protein n=1 Tax=Triticum urartu TaxID=4572 RepID=A0A8R7UNG6_TRIUA